jgi:hypothetical protein
MVDCRMLNNSDTGACVVAINQTACCYDLSRYATIGLLYCYISVTHIW